jgi:hypothetical protein
LCWYPQIYVPEGYTFAGGEYTGVQRTGIKLAVATIFGYSPPAAKVLGVYASSQAWIEAHHMAPGDVHVYIYQKTRWGYLSHYNYSFDLRFRKTNTGWIAE